MKKIYPIYIGFQENEKKKGSEGISGWIVAGSFGLL